MLGDNGKVIGITSAISSEGQYIGAAVPVRYLIDLYLKLKSNVNNVMNTSGSSNTDTLKENGKKKEDYTIITGGKINTIVAIPDDFDLDPYIMHTMNMTVQEFLNKYDEVRKTVVTDAPAITNKTIIAFNTSYCINCDVDNGVGTRVYCMFEKNQDPNNLDIPVTAILQFYKTSPHGTIVKLNASTRACLAVFSDDMFLLDKLIDFYGKNNCRSNDCYSGVITSEGYLITYSNSNGIDATISIYNVMR